MNRRSFIKRTALAVGIVTAVAKAASLPVKARAASSVRSITFDLKRFNILFERERVGNMAEDFERMRGGPWEETVTVTRKGTNEIEKKLVALTPLEADMDMDKVTSRGEFFEEETNESP